MDSLFAAYFKEVENADCIYSDYGFMVYRIKDNECYICHAYIATPFRGTGMAKRKLAHLEDLCKKKGVTEISCNIFKKDNGVKKNLAAYTSQGFKIINETEHAITMCKDL